MLQIGRDVSKNPGTCLQEGIAGIGNLEDYAISVNFRRLNTSEMTDAVKELLKDVSIGGVSQPFATPEGISFFMLCERTEAAAKLDSREEAYNRLLQEKMQRETEKFMRNLRREAYIEMRE